MNIRVKQKKSLYETPEELTVELDKFLENHRVYTRKQLVLALGFKSSTAYTNTISRKGFEHVFDRCTFCHRGRGEQYEPKIKEPKIKDIEGKKIMTEPDIQKYADSIQPELDAYCRFKKVRLLVGNKRIT